MLTTPTERHVPSDCAGATIDGPPTSDGERSAGRIGRIAAYYRLRSIVLEAQIAALEDELERTERRLQETIARYEDILQRRPEQGTVTAGNSSDNATAETDS